MSDAVYDPETLLVGVMGRPHGLRGETTLRPDNPAGSDLARVRELILERASGQREKRSVESIRRGAAGWLVKLTGVASREEADALTNLRVRVSRRALPRPGAGEFFVEDTIGCQVCTESGATIGTVEELFWNGAHDIWIVRGDRETMIPVVPEYVRAVDIAARRIVVAWAVDFDDKDEGDGPGAGASGEEIHDGDRDGDA